MKLKAFRACPISGEKAIMSLAIKEVFMFEKTEFGGERSELVEKANSLKAQFKSTEEAINYYSQALEKICTKKGQTVQDFLMMAETQTEYDPESAEALSLARTIRSLRTVR